MKRLLPAKEVRNSGYSAYISRFAGNPVEPDTSGFQPIQTPHSELTVTEIKPDISLEKPAYTSWWLLP